MIYEDLKKEFLKNNHAAWGLDKDISQEKGFEEVNRHVQIWNKVAEFMDYGILVAPNLIRFIPIYFTRKFPSGKTTVETDEGLFMSEEEFYAPGLSYRIVESHVKSEYMKMYAIHDWSPTLDFNHAKECETRLLQKGKYNLINSHIGSRIVKINYSNSILFGDIFGKGKNELEAICDACINFDEREKINRIKEAHIAALNADNNYPTLFSQ